MFSIIVPVDGEFEARSMSVKIQSVVMHIEGVQMFSSYSEQILKGKPCKDGNGKNRGRVPDNTIRKDTPRK